MAAPCRSRRIRRRRPSRSRASSIRAAIVALALVLATRAHAGPWLPEPGHFYVELRGLFSTTSDAFDVSGGRHGLGSAGTLGFVPTRLDDGGLSLYGEVGIATRLAIVADFQPLRSLRLARSGSDVTAVGIGDLDAGLKLLLFDEEVTCSLTATLGIPTGRSDAALPLGTGDLRGAFVLSIGRVWDHVPVFFSIDLGAIVRSSGDQRIDGVVTNVDYASELVYAGELGYLARITDRVRLVPRVRLDGQHGVRKPTTPVAGSAELIDAPIAPESVRFLRVGAGLGVDVALRASRGPITHVLVDVTGGAFVWGEGIPAAGQVSLAVGVKR